MTTVVLTGAAGDLGQRVCPLISADPAVHHVLAVDLNTLDQRTAAGTNAPVEARRLDLATADLKSLFEGADVVVHLAGATRGATDGAVAEVEIARRVLDAASSAAVAQLVMVTSAAVYGAWANNPVPLTEDAPLRPNPGVGFAIQKAEIERLVGDWREDHPGAAVATLRPAVTVAEGANGWLARALHAVGGIRSADHPEPPGQFVHLDDLATAVDLARRERLDGAYNVAPDGWISGETVRALAGGAPRIRVPRRLATAVAALRFRWGLAPTPPELLPYAAHAWVIANDRLKAEGWEPTLSNEEAYVVSHEAGPWATLSPRRRQEIALAASGVAVLGLAGAVVALVRRRRRRTR